MSHEILDEDLKQERKIGGDFSVFGTIVAILVFMVSKAFVVEYFLMGAESVFFAESSSDTRANAWLYLLPFATIIILFILALVLSMVNTGFHRGNPKANRLSALLVIIIGFVVPMIYSGKALLPILRFSRELFFREAGILFIQIIFVSLISWAFAFFLRKKWARDIGVVI